MSLINDALKKAKQAPPRNLPNSLPPLQPVADDHSPVLVWLVPAVIIILICAAIFFIGWSVAHHAAHSIVTTPETTNSDVAVFSLPTNAPLPAPVVQDNPPDGPVLQGIFYSSAPSAIVDGKTIRPGDKFKQYKVKEITKYTVTLIDKDGKALKLGMSN